MLAAENGNLTIPCRPEAAPSPEIVWMKNGGQLALTYTNGNQGGAQMLLNGYLKIVGVSQGDSGFYTCQAKNVHGSDQTTTNVVVSSTAMLSLRLIKYVKKLVWKLRYFLHISKQKCEFENV